jgi:hypothetical protein
MGLPDLLAQSRQPGRAQSLVESFERGAWKPATHSLAPVLNSYSLNFSCWELRTISKGTALGWTGSGENREVSEPLCSSLSGPMGACPLVPPPGLHYSTRALGRSGTR